MSAAYLGYSFDIHGGGMDLVFPHHENEIAQSCSACKHSNVSYWMHNGFVTVDSEKMSKSLGNFFTIRQVREDPRVSFLGSIRMSKYLTNNCELIEKVEVIRGFLSNVLRLQNQECILRKDCRYRGGLLTGFEFDFNCSLL